MTRPSSFQFHYDGAGSVTRLNVGVRDDGGDGSWRAVVTLHLQNNQTVEVTMALEAFRRRLAHACVHANLKELAVIESCVDLIASAQPPVDVLRKYHDHLRIAFPWLAPFDETMIEPVVLSAIVLAGLVKVKYNLQQLVPS